MNKGHIVILDITVPEYHDMMEALTIAKQTYDLQKSILIRNTDIHYNLTSRIDRLNSIITLFQNKYYGVEKE